jgi:hypothetical protein
MKIALAVFQGMPRSLSEGVNVWGFPQSRQCLSDFVFIELLPSQLGQSDYDHRIRGENPGHQYRMGAGIQSPANPGYPEGLVMLRHQRGDGAGEEAPRLGAAFVVLHILISCCPVFLFPESPVQGPQGILVLNHYEIRRFLAKNYCVFGVQALRRQALRGQACRLAGLQACRLAGLQACVYRSQRYARKTISF